MPISPYKACFLISLKCTILVTNKSEEEYKNGSLPKNSKLQIATKNERRS